MSANGSILCGVDGSENARAALLVAVQLSGQLGLRLVVAHVVPAAVPTSRFGLAGRPPELPAVDAELAAGERLLEQVVGEAGLAGVERRVVYGFPADRLADLADEEGAELVVVGSRGRGALKAAFLGSVSTELIGVARRPVLVVPPGAADAASAATAGAPPSTAR